MAFSRILPLAVVVLVLAITLVRADTRVYGRFSPRQARQSSAQSSANSQTFGGLGLGGSSSSAQSSSSSDPGFGGQQFMGGLGGQYGGQGGQYGGQGGQFGGQGGQFGGQGGQFGGQGGQFGGQQYGGGQMGNYGR